MSHPMKGPERAAQHAQRLDWLRQRPGLLAQLPSATDAIDPEHDEALDSAVRQMKHVRLYAPTATGPRARRGIQLLVSELRGEAIPPAVRSPQLEHRR